MKVVETFLKFRELRGSLFGNSVLLNLIAMTSKSKSATLLTALSLLFTVITTSLTLEIPPLITAGDAKSGLRSPKLRGLPDRGGSPNLGGPPIPYGYSMRITQDPEKPLNATDLYICAIEAMYHWAAEGWEEETLMHNSSSEIIRGLQISYYDIPERTVNIQYNHIILAILIALNGMDRMHAFAETVVEMKQFGKVFGIVKMGKPPTTRRGVEASVNGSTNMTTNDSTTIGKSGDSNSVGRDNIKATAANADSNTSATSKTFNDPEGTYLGSMNITYQRFGTAVDCKLLFSTALDGIAYAAADYRGDTWPFSTTYDWSNKMMYQTVQVKIGDGGSFWTADLIKRVARLLPQRLFRDNECGEVRFRVEIERIGRVGTGSFQVLDFARQRDEARGIE
ncbi:MAG: hypothetical protein Q9221_006662 [Calogaya cf. arnoldii]